MVLGQSLWPASPGLRHGTSYTSYLSLCIRSPHALHLLAHRFLGSGVQVWLRWVFFSRSHRLQSRCRKDCILFWSLGPLPSGSGCWKNSVSSSCRTCWLLAEGRPQVLENTSSPLLQGQHSLSIASVNTFKITYIFLLQTHWRAQDGRDVCLLHLALLLVV